MGKGFFRTYTGTNPFWAGLGVAGLLFGAAMLYQNSRSERSFSTGLLTTASCAANGATISTGSFNGNTEVLYYLDSQSGRLTAGLLSRSDPTFIKTYARNVKADLQASVEKLQNVTMPQNPTFIMVSGDSDIRNIGAGEMNNLAKTFIYVAEINTGIVLVYVLPLVGDRDIAVDWGEITFWTSARLNSGGAPRAEAGVYRRSQPNVSAGYYNYNSSK